MRSIARESRRIALGIVLFLMIASAIGSVAWVSTNLSHDFMQSDESADCAVVFGAAVWKDEIPSHALYDRTMAGIELYKNKKVKCLIFSGGASKYGAHEADVMQKIAIFEHVPREDQILDYQGKNTRKTILNLPTDKESFVFVSNDFHLGRIRLLAWKYGIKDPAFHAAHYFKGKYAKWPYFFIRDVGAVFIELWTPKQKLVGSSATHSGQ